MSKRKSHIFEAENGKLTGLTSIGSGHQLNSEAAAAYKKMVEAAKKDGISWGITDSYRPYEIQDKIFDWDYYNKTKKKRKKGTSGTPVAYPGTSNHGWGSALDLKVKYGDPAHKWLTENASKFGFSNPFKDPHTEPWHWEHVESAKKMKSGSPVVDEVPSDLSKSLGGLTKDGGSNLGLAGILGGDALTQWLDFFAPNSENSEKDKKKQVNEEIDRIHELIKKVL